MHVFQAIVCLFVFMIMHFRVLALPMLEKRIFGGSELPGDLAISSVSLYSVIDGNGALCGGTLISPRHVVTVGHCVITADGAKAKNNDITMYYGNPNQRKAKTAQSTKITYLPEYYTKAGRQGAKYDIAVIEFPEIKLDAKTVNRAAIYNGVLQPGQPGLIVGWGGSEKGVNKDLLRGALNIIGKPEACGFEDNNGPQICLPIELTPGIAACGGDSGSGMFVNESGALKLIGFNSAVWGGETSECNSRGTKHSYVNVLYHLDFVQKTTGLSRDYLFGKSGNAA